MPLKIVHILFFPLSVWVSGGHRMPFLSSVFLGRLLGTGFLRDTSYDHLCPQGLPRVKALALCPENSEPNLASATGDMYPEC